LLTIGLLASVALFVLDAQELKAIVSSQMADQFKSTTLRVGFVSVSFLLAFGLLTLCAFAAMPGGGAPRSGRRGSSAKAESADDSPGIIMGR
jgi:hypothetical protein